MSGVGRVKAAAIEADMADYGLTLKDSVSELDKDGTDLSPNQIREYSAKELIDGGQRFAGTGASLINFAGRAMKRRKVGGALKNVLKASAYMIRDVERLALRVPAVPKINVGVNRVAVSVPASVLRGSREHPRPRL